jgi:hypothetical protein
MERMQIQDTFTTLRNRLDAVANVYHTFTNRMKASTTNMLPVECWADDTEIMFAAQLMGAEIHVVRSDSMQMVHRPMLPYKPVHKPLPRITVSLKSYHYQPMSSKKSTQTIQKSVGTQRQKSVSMGGDSYQSSPMPNVSFRNQSTTYHSAFNWGDQSSTKASRGQSVSNYNNSSLSRSSNRQTNNNNHKNNGRHPNINNWNVGFVAGGLIKGFKDVPKDVMEAAAFHGLDSPEFLKAFRFLVKKRVVPSSCVRSSSNAKTREHYLHEFQTEVLEKAKVIATLSRDPEHINRGFLIYASTGSGKTLMCLSIFLAYWNTDRVFYVITTNGNLKNNNPSQYVAYLKQYFPHQYTYLVEKHGDNLESSLFQRVTKSSQKCKKRINFVSLEVFAHKLGYRGVGKQDDILTHKEDSVVVFDESHNLFDEIRGRASKGAPEYILQRLLTMNHRERQKMHVFLASATPGSANTQGQQDDIIANWIQVFAIVAGLDAKYWSNGCPYNTMMTQFKKCCSGNAMKVTAFMKKYLLSIVEFSDIRYNLDMHACVKDIRSYVPSSKWFWGALLFHSQYGDNIDSFMKSLSETVALKQYTILPQPIIETFKEKRLVVPVMDTKLTHNWILSPKSASCLKMVYQKKGKHFIYTKTKKGMEVLAQAFKTLYNYNVVEPKDYGENNNNREFYLKRAQGKKNSTKAAGGASVMMIYPSLSQENIKKIYDIFDSPENVRGKLCKCIIACDTMYEGLDFKALRYIHMLTPMDNVTQETQLAGRGVRFCSHAELPKGEQNVSIIRWFLKPPTQNALTQMFKYLMQQSKKNLDLKTLSSRVRKLEKRMGGEYSKGVDFHVREQYLRESSAVALYNFEMELQAIVKGRKYTPKKRILVLGGRQC